MEGMRDVALADYENILDHEKVKIHNDFNQMIANGCSDFSGYFKILGRFQPEIVDKLLKNCEGYEEGRLDFNDFITVKYVLEKRSAVICKGCSSLILGRPYFSCHECFFHFPEESYDLCSGCYHSRKFEDHHHKLFYDNQKLLRMSRKRVVAEKEKKDDLETRNNRINRAAIEFAISIKTYGLENYLDRVLNFQKNKKLGRDSKEPEETDEEVNSASARLKEKLQMARPRVNLLGMEPTPQCHRN